MNYKVVLVPNIAVKWAVYNKDQAAHFAPYDLDPVSMASKVTKELTLSNNKLLDWSKLKACTDDKINVTENLKFVL